MSIQKLEYKIEWYDNLKNDCEQILNKARIDIGFKLLETKYLLGNRIYQDYEKFGRHEHGNKTQQDLADDLGISQSEISRIIKFRVKVGDKFEEWIEKYAHGHKLTWREIKSTWLVGKTIEQIDRHEKLLERTKDIETSELINLMDKVNELIGILEGLGFEKILTILKTFSSNLAYIILHRE